MSASQIIKCKHCRKTYESSKKISITEKLTEAKEKLQEFYTMFPYLNPDNQDRKKEIDELQKEYDDIIGLL